MTDAINLEVAKAFLEAVRPEMMASQWPDDRMKEMECG